jgi:hypothetical protein
MLPIMSWKPNGLAKSEPIGAVRDQPRRSEDTTLDHVGRAMKLRDVYSPVRW